MVRAVGGGDGVAAEGAARGLKKMTEGLDKAGGEAALAALWGLRKEVFREARRAEDMRVRWNLVIVMGRLPLEGRERGAVVDWLFERLGDESGLTRTFCMQALWSLSEGDAKLRWRVLGVVRRFAETGTAAMRARATKLLGSGA